MSPEEIIHALIERQVTLCTAESCTGGLICAELTSVSGASEVIAGGAVVYQTPMKERILGLKNVTDDNVVSRDVANYMAVQASNTFGADAAIATTGYLEPWKDREVAVFVSLLWPGSGPFCEKVEKASSEFDRNTNRQFTVELAFQMLSERLQ